MTQTKELFTYQPGNTLSFGVTKVEEGVQFAISLPGCGQCFLNLYRKGQKRRASRIALSKKYKKGNAFFVTLTSFCDKKDTRKLAEILSEDFEYMYEVDGKEFADPYASVIHGRERWGHRKENEGEMVRGGISLEQYDWEEDAPLDIAFSDMILYQLHVRGFTRHSSSKVANKGTFDGLKEKIPHLKELGVNGVLLLPCYEFDEIQKKTRKAMGEPKSAAVSIHREKIAETTADNGTDIIKEDNEKTKKNTASVPKKKEDVKLNYWGYGAEDTYYFAPKASYASDAAHACSEMKELVKRIHQAGIEVLMDIYFAPGTNVCLMEDCLRSWVLHYHIDGFRVNQEVVPSIVLASDPILSGVKLLCNYWDVHALKDAGALCGENALADYNEGFMNVARRFLKSDEGQVEPFSRCFRQNDSAHAAINFITHVNGFTLMDLVSYDVKHNEANGEMNRDGTEYNYSWNCGVEGKSRKRQIVSRRMCQIRNAFAMLLLAQGTPMLFAGDEFGNSQQGNNNPYCQDNDVTWLDWRQKEKQKEIFDYVKKMIAFRKEHPVLHQKESLHMFDALSCGMPDFSLHGIQAWRTDFSYYSRMLAVLLYGDYAKKEDGSSDDSIYVIFNMYWETRSFDLPNLPGGKEWYPAMETYSNVFSSIPQTETTKKKKKPAFTCQKKTVVPPRSIVVFVGR